VALTVHAGPALANSSVIWTGAPAAYELWSVVTFDAKLVQTHPGGNGSVVVVVAAGAGAGWGAGVSTLGLVLTPGTVVVVVVVDGTGAVAGDVFTFGTAL
jgi:hypothetical protein